MKLINFFFLKKSWLVLKLKVFFTTSKKKKSTSQSVNRGLALSSHGPFGPGQKSSNFFGSRILRP